MNKIISPLLASILLLSCGKSSNKSHHREQNALSAPSFNHLTNRELSKVLLRTLSSEKREQLLREVDKLTTEEINEIFEITNQLHFEQSLRYYYPDDDVLNSERLIQKLITHPGNEHTVKFSYDQILQIQTLSYVRSKAVQNIVNSYEKMAQERINDLKGHLLEAISEDPTLSYDSMQKAKHQNKKDFIEEMSRNKAFLEKLDQFFKKSQLTIETQETLLISGLVAGALYPIFKDSSTIKDLVREAKKLSKLINDVTKKVKEVKVLVDSLEKHFKDTKDAYARLEEGLKKEDWSMKQVSTELKNKRNTHVYENLIQEVKSRILGKKENAKDDNPSILSQQFKVGEGITQSIAAARDITYGVTNIIKISTDIAGLIGITPDKEMQKLFSTIEKVASTVSLIDSAITGLAGGGVMGALTAVQAIGSINKVFGGGGPSSDAIMNAKLDMILKNQQKIMELQMATINMVKELALMVDEYHAQEMFALNTLVEQGNTHTDMLNNIINKELSSCDLLVANYITKNQDPRYSKKAGYNFYDFPLIKERLKEVNSYQELKKLLDLDGHKDSWKGCLSSLESTFMAIQFSSNPVSRKYKSEDQGTEILYIKHAYPKLLNVYYSQFKDNKKEYVAHFPHSIATADYDGALLKGQYIERFIPYSVEEELNLQELIAPESLERFVTHLLWAIPFYKMEKKIQSLDSLKDKQIKQGNDKEIKLLKQALFLTRSAIAQNVILSGEPIFKKFIETKNFEAIFTNRYCSQSRDDLCYLRSNKPLMRNALHFFVAYNLNSERAIEEYKLAFERKDKEYFKRFFMHRNVDYNFEKNALKLTLNYEDMKLAYELAMPTVEDIRQRKIIYPESMLNLVKMQDAIIQEILNLEESHNEKESLYQLLTL